MRIAICDLDMKEPLYKETNAFKTKLMCIQDQILTKNIENHWYLHWGQSPIFITHKKQNNSYGLTNKEERTSLLDILLDFTHVVFGDIQVSEVILLRCIGFVGERGKEFVLTDILGWAWLPNIIIIIPTYIRHFCCTQSKHVYIHGTEVPNDGEWNDCK